MRAIPPASTSGTGCGCTSWCVDLDLNHFSPLNSTYIFKLMKKGTRPEDCMSWRSSPIVSSLSLWKSLSVSAFSRIYLSMYVGIFSHSFPSSQQNHCSVTGSINMLKQEKEEEQEANWCTQFILLPSTEACAPRRHLMATSRKQPREDMLLVFTRPNQTRLHHPGPQHKLRTR
uniref:(northern house mosquito) hypothetical protein n=1 Tax=Culex pipiens TaxID=7175 RepID=A0A8D8AAG2_CULPI